jgi:pimeloyl-ACP methyl ester carboxylesterase
LHAPAIKDLVVPWSSDTLSGKPADIFTPEGSESASGVVVFLHGYDGVTIRDNPAYTSELNRNRLACVCPHGPECWWTDRVFEPFDATLSPIDFLAQQLPEYCLKKWGLEPSRLGVTGIEMGGQGALQLSYRHARKFSIVVAISPKVDFRSSRTARRPDKQRRSCTSIRSTGPSISCCFAIPQTITALTGRSLCPASCRRRAFRSIPISNQHMVASVGPTPMRWRHA